MMERMIGWVVSSSSAQSRMTLAGFQFGKSALKEGPVEAKSSGYSGGVGGVGLVWSAPPHWHEWVAASVWG
jgi:hypothetical protein